MLLVVCHCCSWLHPSPAVRHPSVINHAVQVIFTIPCSPSKAINQTSSFPPTSRQPQSAASIAPLPSPKVPLLLLLEGLLSRSLPAPHPSLPTIPWISPPSQRVSATSCGIHCSHPCHQSLKHQHGHPPSANHPWVVTCSISCPHPTSGSGLDIVVKVSVVKVSNPPLYSLAAGIVGVSGVQWEMTLKICHDFSDEPQLRRAERATRIASWGEKGSLQCVWQRKWCCVKEIVIVSRVLLGMVWALRKIVLDINAHSKCPTQNKMGWGNAPRMIWAGVTHLRA